LWLTGCFHSSWHSHTQGKRNNRKLHAESNKRNQKALPQPNSDFYQLVETLPADELAVLKQVRTFMETRAAPIITKYRIEDSCLFELLPAMKELNIGGDPRCSQIAFACGCLIFVRV